MLRALLIAAFTVFLIPLLAAGDDASASDDVEEFFPPEPDPFVGDYVGRWGPEEDVNPNIAAQVIAHGNDRYRIIIKNKLDMRCPSIVDVEVFADDGKLTFEDGLYHGETDGQTFTGGRGSRGARTFSMTRWTRQPPSLGMEPPENAVVLFDGSNLDAWEAADHWTITEDGALIVSPDAEDYLRTKDKWTDLRLHIEFRLPFMPRARGQQRGNSGVFLHDTYEVQVLDSYGLEGYYNECGALYKLSAPHVNACAPPLEWQTYDIIYDAPAYDATGRLQENGRMTVYHNGVLIHSNQELKWITAWKEVERQSPPPREPGPISLQSHDNYIQFRNIWAVDLSE